MRSGRRIRSVAFRPWRSSGPTARARRRRSGRPSPSAPTTASTSATGPSSPRCGGGPRRRACAARSSPSTATRPWSCVPSRRPRLLTDLDQKLELLASTGVDVTLVVRFDEERAAESAEDFVREVVVGLPRRPGGRRGRGLPLRPPAGRHRRPAAADGRGAGLHRRGPGPPLGPRRGRRGRRHLGRGRGRGRARRPRGEGQLDRHPGRPRGRRHRPGHRPPGPAPRGPGPGHAGRQAGPRARLPHRQRGRAGRDPAARRRHLRRLVRAPGRHRPAHRHQPGPAAHVLRAGPRLAAGGPRPRLRRRPLRRARGRPLRRPPPRRDQVPLGRGPGRGHRRATSPRPASRDSCEVVEDTHRPDHGTMHRVHRVARTWHAGIHDGRTAAGAEGRPATSREPASPTSPPRPTPPRSSARPSARSRSAAGGCPAWPATPSPCPTATRSASPSAAGASRWCWSTGSAPRGCSTPRPCRAWSEPGSGSSPSTPPATAAPSASPRAAPASSTTPGCWPGCSTSSASSGRSSPATRWAGGSSPSWPPRSPTGPSPWCCSTPSSATPGTAWSTSSGSPRRCSPAWPGSWSLDTVTTVPLFRDPAQARKLGRLLAPVVAGHVRRPWRMMGPAVSIMRSRGSGWMLDRIAEEGIPLVVIHGERDVAVPMATARDAARRGDGTLVTVAEGRPLVAAARPPHPAGHPRRPDRQRGGRRHPHPDRRRPRAAQPRVPARGLARRPRRRLPRARRPAAGPVAPVRAARHHAPPGPAPVPLDGRRPRSRPPSRSTTSPPTSPG